VKTDVGVKDVFTAYGEAAYNAQVMEYDLVTIWMLDSISQGVAITRQDLVRCEREWGKKTFGQLTRPLRDSSLVPKEVGAFLDELRIARNHLMHGFFLDKTFDLQTASGRENAVTELRRLNAVIQRGQVFLADVLRAYLRDFGVDAADVVRQALRED
jgi:hypothetical protein